MTAAGSRELQLQCGRREVQPAEQLLQVDGELLAVEASRGDIDGDGPSVPLALPLRSLAKRALHDVARQPVDEARPLGDRPQRFPCEQPVRRVLPAEHRLDTGHRSRRQLDLRLVEEGELALLERPPQLAADGEPGPGVAVLVGVVHGRPGARPLRDIHGDVGVLKELVHAGAVVRIEGDPDARLDLERHPMHGEGLRQDSLHAFDESGRLAPVHAREQEAELVTSQTGNGLGTAHALAEAVFRARAEAGLRSGARGCRSRP